MADRLSAVLQLPVKHVAIDVGYANASALGRVFAQHLGSSPAAWKARDIERARPVVPLRVG